MERLPISAEQQALIDAYKAENASTFDPEPAAGSNIVEGDDLEVDNNWKVRVIAGQWGCVACLIPEWGDFIMAVDLVDYVTDRAGPAGQTLPIYDPAPEAGMSAAAKTQAVTAEPKQKHGRHRSLQDALRDAVKRLAHDQQKTAREKLKQAGVLSEEH